MGSDKLTVEREAFRGQARELMTAIQNLQCPGNTEDLDVAELWISIHHLMTKRTVMRTVMSYWIEHRASVLSCQIMFMFSPQSTRKIEIEKSFRDSLIVITLQ